MLHVGAWTTNLDPGSDPQNPEKGEGFVNKRYPQDGFLFLQPPNSYTGDLTYRVDHQRRLLQPSDEAALFPSDYPDTVGIVEYIPFAKRLREPTGFASSDTSAIVTVHNYTCITTWHCDEKLTALI